MRVSVNWQSGALVSLAWALSIASVHAADFVYTNNDLGANTVSAFSVGPTGVLTPVPGSPFSTAGLGLGGGFFASNRATTRTVGNTLYAANGGSNSVSAFTINPSTGVLIPVAGSPFATGGSAGFFGISLAATPNDLFLFAANGGSANITVYSIAASGALTPIVGSPFPAGAGGAPDGIKVTPDGNFLAVARPIINAVSMFAIGPTGALTAVAGSPFSPGLPGLGSDAGVDIRCSGDRLFAGRATAGSTAVDVFSIAPTGALAVIPGSPFSGPGINSNVPLLNADDLHLFVSNQFSSTVTAFSVAASGALTVVAGSPFPTGGGIAFPAGMATDQAGSFLYVANDSNTVSVFSIAGTGTLTPAPGSPFATGTAGALLSLTAFPPKSCCPVPVISGVSASPSVLWPPNHSFVDVIVSYTVTDPCANTCTLEVSSNEPIDGLGDGNTSPDWNVVDSHDVQLRAERSGRGTGRIYTITVTCTNNTNGKSSSAITAVTVPHDQH